MHSLCSHKLTPACCRLALAVLYLSSAAGGQPVAQQLQGLAHSVQQLHHRPYLPRGTAERCLLLLITLLQVLTL